MNDLNEINRLNNEATERAIPAEQAKGLWVTAEYAGLAFVGYTTHRDERSANAKALYITRDTNPSGRSKVFPPTKHPDDVLLEQLGIPTQALPKDPSDWPADIHF